MNKEQHIYMHYLIKNMDQVDQDLQRAIIRMQNKWQVAPPELVHAMRKLSAEQKNQVVREVLMGVKETTKYGMQY
ncbi:hypothetical protein AB0Y04_01000 [Loigolactobacillus coryniformis]|uniref:hypothetical protein n=1 Tax=Loigolactobacillus coryniformis TaxID=1610 RepID=UPI003F1F6B48